MERLAALEVPEQLESLGLLECRAPRGQKVGQVVLVKWEQRDSLVLSVGRVLLVCLVPMEELVQ